MIPKIVKQQVLAQEGYVEVQPMWKDSPEYKILYKKKEEIRKYKWYRGEENINLTWEEAVQQWESLYQDGFDKYIDTTFLGYAMASHLDSLPSFRNYTDDYGYISSTLSLQDYHSMKYVMYKFPKTTAFVLFSILAFPITLAILFYNYS